MTAPSLDWLTSTFSLEEYRTVALHHLGCLAALHAESGSDGRAPIQVELPALPEAWSQLLDGILADQQYGGPTPGEGVG